MEDKETGKRVIYLILLLALVIPIILCVMSVGPFELNVGIFIILCAIASFVMSADETGRTKTRSITTGIFGLLLGGAFLWAGISKLIGK